MNKYICLPLAVEDFHQRILRSKVHLHTKEAADFAMAGRITRGAAAREAAALLALSPSQASPTPLQLSSPPTTPITRGTEQKTKPVSHDSVTNKKKKTVATADVVVVRRTTRNKKPSKKSEEVTLPPTPPISTSKGKKRKRGPIEEPDINELPHNLGKVTAAPETGVTAGTNAGVVGVEVSAVHSTAHKVEDNEPNMKDVQFEGTADATEVGEVSPSKKTNKKKVAIPYGLTPGASPFPNWQHPTPEECEEVNRTLSELHGEVKAPASIPAPSLTITGCGEVPSVLDALMRTLLSGATTGANSAMAFQGLVNKFGVLDDGEGKGSVDWNKVRLAPIEDVYQAMRSGGLAESKSKYIKRILDMVYEENLTLWNGKSCTAAANDKDTRSKNGATTEDGKPIPLSLNHLHTLSKDEAMLQFVKYPGIGVKTAACVILFCLQRPCFAVDTHVFRLSKWLGWLPSAETPEQEPELDGKEKQKKPAKRRINEITAFSHLEVRIPEHLKYPLHQLFIRHGKVCPRCRAITGESSEDWDKGCVIDHLVTRTGKRKGQGGGESSATPAKKLKKGKGKKKAVKKEDETESGSEYEE